MQHASLIVLVITSALLNGPAIADELPPVSGASYDGELVTWDPVEGAKGYNLYRGPRYHATVVGVTSYIPEFTGTYSIAAFDDAGNYGRWFIEDYTSNVVVVDSAMPDISTPEISGLVYSTTAGEVFWDRVLSRDLEYRVFLNEVPVTTTTGTSFLLSSLVAGQINRVSVIAQSGSGRQSGRFVLDFDTRSDAFPTLAVPSDDTPFPLRPDSPRNVRLDVYSADTAELFWDREAVSSGIVAVDVYRDGELLGSTNGTSYYDGAGVFGFNRLIQAPHKYELVAIDTQGGRSVPAIVNPGALDGAANEVTQRMLSVVTEVTNSNPHQQWFPLLRALATSDTSDQLEAVTVEPMLDNGVLQSVRTVYNCNDGGTLTKVSTSATIGSSTLTFSECDINAGWIDGDFSLTGRDAGGYSAVYDQLFVDLIDFPVDMSGTVELSIGRATGSKTISYVDFQYYIIGNLLDDDGLDTVVTLNQQLSDAIVESPRRTLTTGFTANGPWTNGRDITVTTTQRFENPLIAGSGGNPHYAIGELVVEEGESDRLVILADTGDAGTWSATLNRMGIEGQLEETLTGSWGELARLPCLAATTEDAELSGCSVR